MLVKQPSLLFVNTRTGVIKKEIWNDLGDGYWRLANLAVHETNTLKGVLNRAKIDPVLAELIPIEVGQTWNQHDQRIEEARFTPKPSECDIDKLLEKSKSFFDILSVLVQM